MTRLEEVPLQNLQGVGPQKAKDLAQLGIEHVGDLLNYFPYRYDDFRIADITEAVDGEKTTLRAVVYGQPVVQRYGRSKSRMTCKLMAGPMLISAVWFNQHFLKSRLVNGEEVVISGKWEARRRQITVSHVESEGGEKGQADTLQPVYSLSGALSQRWMRQTMQRALDRYGDAVDEWLPQELIEEYGFPPRRDAVFALHQPKREGDAGTARKRMVYEELFLFQMRMQIHKAKNEKKADGVQHAVDLPAVRDFVRKLPFRLTKSQLDVTAEIMHDMQQPFSMNRLLQGDVGAGKTVVAAVSLFAAVTAGAQGALMVPTEILAEQHKRSLEQLFTGFDVQVALLTGSIGNRPRRETLDAVQMGLIDIVVGTHALIQEDVFFRRLGLVITDEQHRFGVNQRSLLRRKGWNPDVLMMTATPIPRTLAISVFGDMDVSSLKELPKGRKAVRTYSVRHDLWPRVMEFIRKEVELGRQAYVVCPLIEESEKLDVQNAMDVYAELTHTLQPLTIGLLHGRLPPQEKDELMREFSEGRIQVLVATTVIEVGVDVPNATLMVVYDADRFGLSQLHQLRGRVGRGKHQSHCVLIADPKNDVARSRMKAMTETNDGFVIAERDLSLRGPGDFFGTKQSGMPEFRLADMVHDFEWMERSRDDAMQIIDSSDFWTSVQYARLRDELQLNELMKLDVLD